MKVLQVINSLGIGGAEKLIVDSILCCAGTGCEVDVLLLNGKDTNFKSVLQQHGVRVFSLGKENNIYNPLLIGKLIPLLEKYEVVHVHLFPAQYWVAIATLFLKKKPRLITTEHNTTNRRRDIWGFKWVDRFVYKRYDRVVAISPQTKQALTDYINDIEIRTILNGVNIKQFQIAKPYPEKEFLNRNGHNVSIIQVAGFRNQKDQDTVIKAVAQLPANYHLFLVGDGPRRRICEEMVRELNMVERIHFLGLREDIPELLKSADIVVMSSHWEGFGLAAVEGMAAGKPVVASDVSGLAEIVRNYGLLFKTGDAHALALLIERLSEDAEFYEEVASRCAIRACDFDLNKMVGEYGQLYKELC